MFFSDCCTNIYKVLSKTLTSSSF